MGHKTLSVSVPSGRAPPKWIKEHGQDAVLELMGRAFQDCSSVERGIGNLNVEVWGDGWGVHGGRMGGQRKHTSLHFSQWFVFKLLIRT